MTDTRDLHREIPELMAGHADVVSFADFCRFLTGDVVAVEADAVELAVRTLLDATESRLTGRRSASHVPGPRRGG
jgi:hypothetical protein